MNSNVSNTNECRKANSYIQTIGDPDLKVKAPMVLVSLAAVFGGGETYLENLIRLISPELPSVVVCIHPEIKRRVEDAGALTIFADLSRGWKRCLRIPFGFAAAAWALIRYRSRNYLLNGFAPAALAAPLRLLAVNVIVVGHLNLTERSTLAQRLFRHRRYLISLRFASRVICVSNEVARELRTLFPTKDIVVIPNWVNDIPPSLKRRHAKEKFSVLFVGRITKLKGLRVLIEAMRDLADCELVVVGDGADRAVCEQDAIGLAVHFAGFKDNPREYYDRADCLVNPSFGPEGSSMVALDAMAHGLPVIMSDIPVFREVSGNGTAAQLFETGNAQDLVARVRMLLDPSMARAHGVRGYEWVCSMHSDVTARRKYFDALDVTNQLDH